MRLLKLYQIFDNKAQTTHGPIMAAVNPVAITREIEEHANNTATTIGRHPEDYELRQIGILDEETGMLMKYDKDGELAVQFIPVHIVNCSELVHRPRSAKQDLE